MLATPAGLAALGAWARAIAAEVDGLYLAVDFDVLDAGGGWAVQMPEPHGLSLDTALAAVRTLADGLPVVGFGATGINLLSGGNVPATADAVVRPSEAALRRLADA